MFCPECGKEIPDNAKFCMYCSYDLRTITASRQKAPEKPAEHPSRPTGKPSAGDALDEAATVVGAQAQIVLGNRYELREELGRGGMGIVYLAFDRQLEMEIALKVLPPELSHDEKAIRQLKEEAKAAMQLSHPNIVRLHNFEEAVEAKFITMELIRGPSLAKSLTERDRLPVEEVMRIAKPVCAGLEYAHSRLIIHRDIKPANVMVDSDGTPKITDFGIARIVRDTMSRLTQQTTAGTLVYMSPEQMAGQKIDKRTDIYALGATFYELLSGHPPFYQGGIEYQVMNVPPEPLEGVPEHVNKAILTALAKSPEKRFVSAEEFGLALTSPGNIAVAAPPPPQPKATGPREAAPPKASPEPETPSTAEMVREAVVPPFPPKKKPGALRRIVKYSALTVIVLFALLLAIGFYETYRINQLPEVVVGGEIHSEMPDPSEPVMFRLGVTTKSTVEVVVEAGNSQSAAPPAGVRPGAPAGTVLALGLTQPAIAQDAPATGRWTPILSLRTTRSGPPRRTALGSGDPPVAAIAAELEPDTYVVVVESWRGAGLFRLLVNEAAPELPIGGTVEGSLASVGSKDTYRVEVDREGPCAIAVMAVEPQLDPRLTLANAADGIIESDDDGDEGLNAVITRDLRQGLYHVIVAGAGTSAGGYVASASPIENIRPGEDVGGAILFPKQAAYYRLEVGEEGDIEVVAESRGDFDPLVTVRPFGEDADAARAADDGGAQKNALLYVAVQPGTYFVAVRGSGSGQTGEFRLRVAAAAPELGWGRPVSGRLSGGTARYRFTVSERTRYEFRVSGDGDLTPTLAIREAGGGQAVISETASGNSLVATPTLESGNYELLIGGAADTSGSFTLTAEEPIPSLAIGSSRSGILATTSGRATYRMVVNRGGFVGIRLDKSGGSTALDPKVYLHNSAGREIASDDDSGPDNNSYLVRYLTPGTYQVAATAYAGGGAFTVSAENIPVTGRIGLGETTRGVVSERSPLALYELRLSSPASVTIAMNRIGTEIDPKLELYNDAGSLVASDDDGGGSLNARISQSLSQGTYYLLANDVGFNNSGSFTLDLSTGGRAQPANVPEPRLSGAAATLVSVGTTRTGRLTAAGAEDTYRLILDERTPVVIEATKSAGSSFDPKIILRDTNGSGLMEDDDGGPGNDARLVLALDGGVYFLAVTGAVSTTGGYSLRISSGTIRASLSLGDRRDGYIAQDGDRDLYLLTVTSRTRVVIRMDGAGSDTDPYLYLTTSQGRLVGRDDDGGGGHSAQISETLDAGTYVIIATCFSDKVGRYTLTVRR